MFEYDRLALDITQQIFSTSPTNAQKFYQYNILKNKNNESICKFSEKTKQSLLTSPKNHNVTKLSSKKSPIAINGIINEYCQLLHQQQNQIFFSKSNESIDETTRLLSGSCNSYNDCFFDCGASSGYGSPGVAGTPLASPAPNSVHYIAHQLQKMLDQEFCETIINSTNNHCPLTFDTSNLRHSTLKVNSGNILNTSTTHSQQIELPNFSTDTSTSTVNNFSLNENIDFNLDDLSWKKLCFDNFDDNDFTNEKLTATNINDTKSKKSDKTFLSNASFKKETKKFVTLIPNTPSAAAIDDGFSATEIAQFAQLLCSPKKAPPQRYQCHICYQTGHYISDCPMRFNSLYEELTPYQGRKKCYGEFQCQLCKRKWTSQNSVANEAQSCIKCHVPVFPHKQLPVDKAIALGLVKGQRVTLSKISPIGHGRPNQHLSAIVNDKFGNRDVKTNENFLSSFSSLNNKLFFD